MSELAVLNLPSPDATDRLAGALARVLGAGDTLLLEGDLGAGKSHIARVIVQQLQAPHGPPEDVPSPTYTLVQTYRAGDLAILHADLYRLGDPGELIELGLDEALGRDLCLIEWPDRLGDLTPPDALRLTLRMLGEGRMATLSGPAAMGAKLGALCDRTHA
ncbi:tRNA (adenosine(37)-N6)-threonylcarbamoyltransferase complex ATPase subunit type 1 TsaE [Palleronia sediminis]|uniref:tRNA threonylcarbamoyladenosine biosynthesis protein TsaE n=1 Tax=Palleronia sediminis TaxID=2547833 RepID=A0A4R6A6G4_9RHOB|nr:tRNA (adenosine(37)-N6)-threonylcarbamoyltransferase complex ATPase subunit type 1 TsaE [Palleronia sediminis]TDL78352.1 tRNA (adenosine(37)-N6)-threonylcarbamoyltransferase complex ATPase subunit type 1 TsaE [Palleronia sediminis]